MFDFLIRNATVLDGSGGPRFVADIALAGGRIAAIGKVSGDAARTIDAAGLVVAPGFIDIHSHTDSTLFIDGRAESKITQGITTELCGNCGFSPAPCLDESGCAELESWRRKHGVDEDWRTLSEMLSALERHPIGVNFATLVGHSNLRAAAIGLANCEASAYELDEMKRSLREAMDEGAFGMSCGLIYPPSCYANTAELIELASVVAHSGGIYATHLRNEHDELVSAVEEAIAVGRCSGARVQISHHKACGSANWGRVETTLAMIAECRGSGMDITVDQYPYIASATSLSVLIPQWVHEGGDAALLGRIRSMRKDLLVHLGQIGENDGGWKNVLISSAGSDKNRRCEGMSILDIARERKTRPEEVVLDLLSEEKLAVSMVHFTQCEEDVSAVMRSDAAMFGSDASARSLSGELSRGKPHPRAFGAYPRVLGRYVREQGVIGLELAIRKMTSAPARKMGLADRGLLRERNWADVVIFDPNEVSDTATYENPHQISQGIRYVFVNGRLAVENGVLTGEMAGRVLRKT
ncbi:MAG: N-acyl-D-amino-acid deacylase family protein [Armatimonadota bacterium]